MERLRPRDPTYERMLGEVLAREGTTVVDTITETLDTTDVAERLRVGGLSDTKIEAVRRRLLVP